MSRTRAGRDFISDVMFKTPQPNPAVVIALADRAYDVPAQGANDHATLGGDTDSEARLHGFERAIAVYVHTTGAQTSTLQRTFTNTSPPGANPHTIYAVGVISPVVAGEPGAPNTGILVFETAEPNPPVLTGTDSLNQTVSVDFGS